jgi:hypothetical protein
MKEEETGGPCGTLGEMLKSMLKKQGMRMWTGCFWVWIGTSGGLGNRGMKLQVQQKAGNILTSSISLSFFKKLRSEVKWNCYYSSRE